MTTVPNAPMWSPPTGTDVVMLRAHEDWDAVRIVGPLADQVLERLGDGSGAVIEDSLARMVYRYWLIPPCAADDWELPDDNVAILGVACFVGVPPRDKTFGYGVRWLIPWGRGRGLTDADLLWDAISSS